MAAQEVVEKLAFCFPPEAEALIFDLSGLSLQLSIT
jgi:hypothetical protein